ncbi:hypothetical protein Asi03nite_58340 [Actinoplanes siamensis]|uniref:Uncharacterized protein n=1 Tax=Actinoplanes siamensis TaxID=1223317 RepID=A0A919NCE9_9ACTN|nr:hypothetical protein Asi03nite_58340 [Actinoplanes siamensis]
MARVVDARAVAGDGSGDPAGAHPSYVPGDHGSVRSPVSVVPGGIPYGTGSVSGPVRKRAPAALPDQAGVGA